MVKVGIVVVLLLGVFYFLCEIKYLLIELFQQYQVFIVILIDFNLGILLLCLLYLMMNMVCIFFCMILE